MPDREKVIDELIMLKRFIPSTMWEPISDAIELLKEQQQQIWELQDQVEYFTDKQKEQKFLVDSDGKITPLPVVVYCKDCIWFHKPDAETKRSCKCNYHGCITEENKYCWWGEKDG